MLEVILRYLRRQRQMDGNFTTALGIPTLDGLGGVGEGAHAEREHVLISELPKRAALLAKLLGV